MELIGRSFSFGFEAPLMAWLQSQLPPMAISVLSAFSALGEELILVLLMGFVYWVWDKEMGRYIALHTLLGIVFASMVKNVFLRRRPYFDHPEVRILRAVEPEADIYDIAAQGYSFPSMHSENAVTFYGSAATGFHRQGDRRISRVFTVAALLFSLLVGLSRVVVGAHYPTDVLAGWLFGVVILLVLPRLMDRIRRREVLYGLLLVLCLPGLLFCHSEDYYSSLGLLLGFMASVLFETRFVRFEGTRKPLHAVLRVALGLALFLGLNTLLKLPFSSDFLDSGTRAALLLRTARYGLSSFVVFGIYPMLFRWF